METADSAAIPAAPALTADDQQAGNRRRGRRGGRGRGERRNEQDNQENNLNPAVDGVPSVATVSPEDKATTPVEVLVSAVAVVEPESVNAVATPLPLVEEAAEATPEPVVETAAVVAEAEPATVVVEAVPAVVAEAVTTPQIALETAIEAAAEPVTAPLPVAAPAAVLAATDDLDAALSESGLVMVQTTSAITVAPVEAPVKLGRPRKPKTTETSQAEPLVMVETQKPD